jgi:hypothetical protein
VVGAPASVTFYALRIKIRPWTVRQKVHEWTIALGRVVEVDVRDAGVPDDDRIIGVRLGPSSPTDRAMVSGRGCPRTGMTNRT